MERGGEPPSGRTEIVYCIVPRAIAPAAHEPLRRHFKDRPEIRVVVERRGLERRAAADRRADAVDSASAAAERRQVHNLAGRRVGERRATLVPVAGLELPRRLRRYADRLVFVERLEPAAEHARDLDTARLVIRFQEGEAEVFGEIYIRYFDRVYNYLRLLVNDPHTAEDVTQQAFTQVLAALPRYERRSQPFRAWLFAIVRNCAIDVLRERNRTEVTETGEIDRRREVPAVGEEQLAVLDWITDPELLMFIERLPVPQRQVLLLRYMLDLSFSEIAQIMGRREDDVRAVQYRALTYLRGRLEAIGRGHSHGTRIRMRRTRTKVNVLRARRYALVGPGALRARR